MSNIEQLIKHDFQFFNFNCQCNNRSSLPN